MNEETIMEMAGEQEAQIDALTADNDRADMKDGEENDPQADGSRQNDLDAATQETGGMSEPLIIDLSGIETGGEEEKEDLSGFQHIVPGFFAQTKEPALTINGKSVGVNAAAVRLFPDVDFMEILINTDERKVAFKPCDELNIAGYQWARDRKGKRYATTRTGLPFVLCVCQIMGWDPNRRYRILGKKIPSATDEEILLFDLKAGQGFEKPNPGEKGKSRSTILTGWNGTFGPAYGEGGGSLHVGTFDGYTYFSIKNGEVQKPEAPSDATNPDTEAEPGPVVEPGMEAEPGAEVEPGMEGNVIMTEQEEGGDNP